MEEVEKSWKRIRGADRIALLLTPFNEGIPVLANPPAQHNTPLDRQNLLNFHTPDLISSAHRYLVKFTRKGGPRGLGVSTEMQGAVICSHRLIFR